MPVQVSGVVHPYIRASYHFPINISIHPGNALAVCGLNGSGKTTFLKLLLNEIIPKKGIIKSPSELAYLSTKNGMKSHLTVQQQLPYFSDKYAEFPWPEFFNKLYKDLSMGQQRLTALWAILHNNQPLILIDEPFSYLDNNSCYLTCGWIITQLKLKKTIIFTHHNSEDLKDIHPLQILDLNTC